jgi:hypothetical protein
MADDRIYKGRDSYMRPCLLVVFIITLRRIWLFLFLCCVSISAKTSGSKESNCLYNLFGDFLVIALKKIDRESDEYEKKRSTKSIALIEEAAPETVAFFHNRTCDYLLSLLQYKVRISEA